MGDQEHRLTGPDPRAVDDVVDQAAKAHFGVEESLDRQEWEEAAAHAARLAEQAAQLALIARNRV